MNTSAVLALTIWTYATLILPFDLDLVVVRRPRQVGLTVAMSPFLGKLKTERLVLTAAHAPVLPLSARRAGPYGSKFSWSGRRNSACQPILFRAGSEETKDFECCW
jgi:hypothetical protein